MTREVHDPIHEGIVLAIDGVKQIMMEDNATYEDAVRLALADVDVTWVFEPYGMDAELIHNACRSQLRDMAVSLEGRG